MPRIWLRPIKRDDLVNVDCYDCPGMSKILELIFSLILDCLCDKTLQLTHRVNERARGTSYMSVVPLSQKENLVKENNELHVR